MIPADALPLRTAQPLDLLAGVRVLDITTSIAGPAATQLLGDLGADIVKIERPIGGDDARSWGPPFLGDESLWFISVNRNKRSLTLDIRRDQGYALFAHLVAKADVLVVNLVLPAQQKLRIDSRTLSALNRQLIHVSITGFGLQGRRADQPCYDLIAEGYSGIMDLTGEAASGPQKVGAPAADLLAGSDAAMATIAALYRRQNTGKGCQIDVSLVDSMTRFVAPRITTYLGSGEEARRSGGRDSVIAIYQVFETADHPMTLALGNDSIWGRFWSAVGQPEFALDVRYASNALRREHRAQLVADITMVLRKRPRAEWLAVFEKKGVPAGPIYRLSEVTSDPEFLERQLFYSTERAGIRVPQIGLGIQFDGRSEGCAAAPPKLGEHTDAVLREWLGTTAPDIAELRVNQIL
jgi:crotonobetainyl-CoA:carnitine CoA-transferase CaiB-like acyl-CoA transferase